MAQRRAFILNGAKVREMRERLGWNQPELARRCNITQSAMSRLESGQSNGSPASILTIAQQLGVRIDDITIPATRPEPEPVAS